MNILKINNGKVEIRRVDSGNIVRTIGDGSAIFAEFNAAQDLVLVTNNKGKVEIRRADSGNIVRTIGDGNATQARWMGEDIAVTTNKGKTEIRRATGNIIRTI
jgi:hypothetical protein